MKIHVRRHYTFYIMFFIKYILPKLNLHAISIFESNIVPNTYIGVTNRKILGTSRNVYDANQVVTPYIYIIISILSIEVRRNFSYTYKYTVFRQIFFVQRTERNLSSS